MATNRTGALVLILAGLLAGCGKPHGMLMQRLDPSASAASGLPQRPSPDQPSPLMERPSFGLYAEPPDPATLKALTTGTLSPDGKFRGAVTDQGAWVVRVDGAWMWQIELRATDSAPSPDKPGTPPRTAPAPAPGPQRPRVTGPMTWTTRNTLLVRDDKGAWWEANPDWALLTALPSALQGKDLIGFSPDGSQVLYYLPGAAGRQVWVAKADGTSPRYLGENVVGLWDEQGKPVLRRITVSPTTPRTTLFRGGRAMN